ncbi:MAG: aminopeptidase [Oscillospiraceae bacterium]|nr:aminopeptidase [Oscillospiraceae bacterium]
MENLSAKELKEKLLIDNKNAGLRLTDAEIESAVKYCGGYIDFLNCAKTERLAAQCSVEMLENHGFRPLDRNHRYKSGEKIYYLNRNKAVIAVVFGKRLLSDGINLVAAHIDSPRLDLKPRPLYEQGQIALFKTHYYGGIKKYQWSAMPLSLIGVIVKKDGTAIPVNIGENPCDPVFTVTDLLPHLANEQHKRSLKDGIKGEELNILIGLTPFRDDDESEKVKLNIIKILHEKYEINEHDFLSAELEAVPAYPAKDVGLDRSMVGGYGQDDRVCSYTALTAMLNTKTPEKTAVLLLADKEEVGSQGNTGLQAAYFRYFLADLAKPHGIEARDILSNSRCLSADVNVAFDPTFPDVLEKRNAAYLNYGVTLTKYTGRFGKLGSSDANAEYLAQIRALFDENNIIWQTGELGKVDEGGGGTVALHLANLDMDVADVGVPVLSMHSPFEITSKLDVYMAHKAFSAFFK